MPIEDINVEVESDRQDETVDVGIVSAHLLKPNDEASARFSELLGAYPPDFTGTTLRIANAMALAQRKERVGIADRIVSSPSFPFISDAPLWMDIFAKALKGGGHIFFQAICAKSCPDNARGTILQLQLQTTEGAHNMETFVNTIDDYTSILQWNGLVLQTDIRVPAPELSVSPSSQHADKIELEYVLLHARKPTEQEEEAAAAAEFAKRVSNALNDESQA